MTETIFKDFFKKIVSSAYTGSDMEHFLIKANGGLAEGLVDNSSKIDLFESSIDLGKTDIEMYVRIMNFCINSSLHCINRMFVRSSIYLISKRNIINNTSLDRNYQQILYNSILIITDNRLLEEIDIIDSSEKLFISLGKSPRIDVPIEIFNKYENEILEILNKKYTQKILKTEYNLESIELINVIRKLNSVYANFGRPISFSSKEFSYSKSNCDSHFQCNLSPFEYDEQIYRSYGILLFPLISDIEIANEKVIVKNIGFGNLDKCFFKIIYKPTSEQLFKDNISIQTMENIEIYLDEVKEKIIQLPSRKDLEFRFEFEKFGKIHVFSFEKKIGRIKEEIGKPRDIYMINNSFNNNAGQQVNINSSNADSGPKSSDFCISRLKI